MVHLGTTAARYIYFCTQNVQRNWTSCVKVSPWLSVIIVVYLNSTTIHVVFYFQVIVVDIIINIFVLCDLFPEAFNCWEKHAIFKSLTFAYDFEHTLLVNANHPLHDHPPPPQNSLRMKTMFNTLIYIFHLWNATKHSSHSLHSHRSWSLASSCKQKTNNYQEVRS